MGTDSEQLEGAALKAPLLAAMAAGSISVAAIAWPDEPRFDMPAQTGKPSTAVSWIDFLIDYPGAGYLDFGGGALVDVVLEHRIHTEPVAGQEHRIRLVIGELLAAYTGADAGELTFRHQLARPVPIGKPEGREWFEWRWILPVWRERAIAS